MIRILILCICTAAINVGSLLASPPKHRFIASDSSKQRIAIISEDGSTEWEMKIGPLHDLHVLPNGNILMQTSWTQIVEVEPKTKKTVWEYNSAKQNGNEGKKIEVHAFQRLANNSTMIAESGASRLLNLNASGELISQISLRVSKSHPHRDTRLVRQIANGNFLVCHEGDGIVKEYLSNGEIGWEFPIPLFGRVPSNGHGPDGYGNQCFCAIRLKNGNTLISTGNGHRVIEVTSSKEIVWQLTNEDLPGIELAWLTSLQVLPNNNIVITNCHAGEKNPQLIEVTRDKKIVWTFQDFKRFGNSLTNSQILSTDGVEIEAQPGTDR